MSGKMGHTPGPLVLGYYVATAKFRAIQEHISVMRPDGSLVAITGATGDSEGEADARLFTAAPDLLAACKHALAYLEERGKHDTAEIAAPLVAAIAKAEGST